jgi:phosphoribosylformylglycinamidine cyclo-ligase
MAVVVGKQDAERAAHQLRGAGESVYRIGRVRARRPGEAQTVIA